MGFDECAEHFMQDWFSSFGSASYFGAKTSVDSITVGGGGGGQVCARWNGGRNDKCE